MTNKVIEASLLSTENYYKNLKKYQIPEVAFLGRSNSGKSTLINRITERKSLAKTSGTPGKTQTINIYNLRFSNDSEIHLADLPGYGYAKLSHKKRKTLQNMIIDYLAHREELVAAFILLDCRRKPTEDELELRDLLFSSGKSVSVVLTKFDKLNQKEKNQSKKQAASLFSLEPEDLLTSDIKGSVQTIVDRICLFA